MKKEVDVASRRGDVLQQVPGVRPRKAVEMAEAAREQEGIPRCEDHGRPVVGYPRRVFGWMSRTRIGPMNRPGRAVRTYRQSDHAAHSDAASRLSS